MTFVRSGGVVGTTPADPGKARRAASGIPIVGAFDGYRALAVLGVVLFHTFQVSGVFNVAGDSAAGIVLWGVLPRCLIAFFIVSGFVMFLPTVVRRGDFGRVSSFAIGRVARIVPAYWLSLVVALVLLATLSHLPGTPAGLPGVGPVLAHFAFLQTPALLVDGPVYVHGVSVGTFPLGLRVIPPVWTLSVEACFYLLLPLIAAAYYRRPLIGLAVAAAIVAVWQVVGLHAGGIASAFGLDLSPATEARFRGYYASQFPSWTMALAAGMSGAWVYVRLRDRVAPRLLERRALWTLLATLPAIVLVVYLTGHEAVTQPDPFNGLFARQSLGLSLAYPLIMATAMVAFSLAPRRVQRPLANEPIRGLADVSYSVYLIHFAVIWFALSQFSMPGHPVAWSAFAWTALVFSVSLLYAYLSAQLLERPVRRWANRLRRRGPRDVLAASAPPPAVAAAAEAPVSSVPEREA
jgi:peptidoglycan/LPS O-acetylase OafA/YrhL